MIAEYLLDPGVAVELRAALGAAPIPSLMLPAAIDPPTLAALRAGLAAAGTVPYDLADRGRYRLNASLRVDGLWTELAATTTLLTGAPHLVAGARWLELGHGDYGLSRDDACTRPSGPHVELTLDLSEACSGEAEIVYSAGATAVIVPQVPAMLSLIARAPSVFRYERPLTFRSAHLRVVRLRVWLLPATSLAPPA